MKPLSLTCFCTILLSTLVLAQSNPVPLINNPLVPDATTPGGASFTLTVNGTGFVSSSVVNWSGSALATTFVSNSQLAATVPAGNIATPSTAPVTVVSPAPGGGTSNVDYFPIRKRFSAVSFGFSRVDTGSGPDFPVVADVNGDGNLDILHVDYVVQGSSAVSVLLGNGDGTFQPHVDYPVPVAPAGLVVGDFNGDGKLDLAISTEGGLVSVLIGNGDGTFQPAQNFSIPTAGVGLTAGDFNADGNLDLAVAIYYPTAQVTILLGAGDGTFQNGATYSLSAFPTSVVNVVTGDFNGDGKLDLAVPLYDDSAVAVLLGNGDGTFQNPLNYATAVGPVTVALADLNGDGKLDLAAQTSQGITVASASVLLGNGDGTFQTHVDRLLPANGYGLPIGDLNGDGRLDVVVPGSGAGITTGTYTLLGNGDGTFQNANYFYANSGGGAGAAIGDFNGDGMPDIVTAANNNTLSVLLQTSAVLSRTVVNFGKVKAGNSAAVKVTLSNIGSSPFTIHKIVSVGQDSIYFSETNNCGSSVAQGSSCNISITFKPGSPGKKYIGAVEVSDTAVNVTQLIRLNGFGTN